MSRLGLAKLNGLQDSQALIVVSHKKEEVPGCVRDWICLPENGTGPPRFGKLDMALELSVAQWSEIWGIQVGTPFSVPQVSVRVANILDQEEQKQPNND